MDRDEICEHDHADEEIFQKDYYYHDIDADTDYQED